MGLAADFAAVSPASLKLATDQGAANALTTSYNAAFAAANAVIAADVQGDASLDAAVVADLSDAAVYPTGQALAIDPAPLPGGSFVLLALAPGTPTGFTAVQVPIAT
jgi:hypothetical protein